MVLPYSTRLTQSKEQRHKRVCEHLLAKCHTVVTTQAPEYPLILHNILVGDFSGTLHSSADIRSPSSHASLKIHVGSTGVLRGWIRCGQEEAEVHGVCYGGVHMRALWYEITREQDEVVCVEERYVKVQIKDDNVVIVCSPGKDSTGRGGGGG